MITAQFNSDFTAFNISGHSESASKGQDVPCAAVSSAVMLTINIISAVGHGKVKEKKNEIIFSGKGKDTITVVKVLYQHLKAIQEEFPKNIQVEVIV